MTGEAPCSPRRLEAGPWGQSCYVIATAVGDAVVIDPGGNAERILSHIAAEGLEVRAILATHGHHDHVGAVAEVMDVHPAPFCLHSADLRVMRRVNFCRSVFHGLQRVRIPSIDIDLARGGVLGFDSVEIEVIHTPGHTPGSVCLEIGGALFTGDTLMASEIGSTAMREADPDALRNSVRDLVGAYGPDTVIHPGHGDSARLGDAVEALDRLVLPR